MHIHCIEESLKAHGDFSHKKKKNWITEEEKKEKREEEKREKKKEGRRGRHKQEKLSTERTS